MNPDLFRYGGRVAVALAAALTAAALPSVARAANGAFAVDDFDTPNETQCKVESWGSFASNSNLIVATAPACAVNFGHVVELSMQLARFRADGEWGTSLQTKAKTNLIPSATGKLGIGIAGGTLHDLVTGETTGLYGYVPFTYGVTDELKLLANAGLLHDRVLDQTFFTYGAGFEWNFVKPLTLIAEVYGQIGPPTDPRSINHPRFQAGLRYTPVELLDIDIIYGRNITGEDANWITLGLNVRFPPFGKK